MSSPLENDYYRYINAITNVLLTLNSAVNFLIYCLIGKKFRRIFVAMVCDGRSRCGGGGGGQAVGIDDGVEDGEEEDAVAENAAMEQSLPERVIDGDTDVDATARCESSLS